MAARPLLLWTLPLRDREVQRSADAFGLDLAPVRLFQPQPLTASDLTADAAALADTRYDALLVGSPAAVPLLQWLHPRVGAPVILSIGHAQAAAQSAGLPHTTVDGDAESILSAAASVGARRLLYLRGPRPLDKLAQRLKEHNIHLDQLPAYDMAPVEAPKLPDGYRGVAFGTGAAVDAFFSLDAATPAFELPCFAAGPGVADVLRDFGIPTIVAAPSRAPIVLLRLAAEYFRDSKPYQG